MNKDRLRTAFIVIAIFVALALIMPLFPFHSQLDTRPDAAHVSIAIRASATSTPTPTSTPLPTSTVSGAPTSTPSPAVETTPGATAAAASTQAVEVVITVNEAATEEQEPDAPAVPAWTTSRSLWNGKTQLQVIIRNEGDVAIQPCLVIPAIYDREGLPVWIKSAEILINANDKPSGVPNLQLGRDTGDICHTGIRGQPAIHFDYRESNRLILPGRSTTLTFVLYLARSNGMSFTGLPYKGQMDVYIPGAPPKEEAETAPQFTPYQSLPFTVQSKPVESYSLAWKSLRDWGLPVLTALLELLAVFLALVLLVFYGYPWLKSLQDDPKLALDTIQNHAEDKSGVGDMFRSMLEDEIDRFRSTGSDQNFSPAIAGTSNTSGFVLPSKLNEQAVIQTIVKILEYIFKPKTIMVTGQLQSSTVKGAGLTVKLTESRSGVVFATETFWELDYCGLKRLVATSADQVFDPNPLLVQAAATWICFEVSLHLKKDYAPLLTGSWRSNAYCLSALHMFGLITQKNAPADAKLRAIDLFRTALSYDADNPVAGINYVRLTYEEIQGAKQTSQAGILKYKLARARLLKIIQNLEVRLPELRAQDPDSPNNILAAELWLYQARYNLAVAASLQAKSEPDEVAPALGQLCILARELAEKAEALPPREVDIGAQPAPESVSENATPVVSSMIAGSPDSQMESQQPTLQEINTYLLRICRKEGRLHHKSQADLLRSMRQSITALLGLMDMDGTTNEDRTPGVPDLQFADKVAGSEDNHASINYRVHYDLACYFSLGASNVQGGSAAQDKRQCYLHGFFHLEQALEIPGDLNNQAKIDSDLKNLREKDAKRFYEIVNRHTESAAQAIPQPDSLDTVLDILREQSDVSDAEELLAAGSTPARRKRLSKLTDGKLSYDSITMWTRIVDLMRLDGVGERYALLLYKAGVISPQVLRGRFADNLRASLQRANDKHSLVENLPTEDTLGEWITQAAALEDVLS